MVSSRKVWPALVLAGLALPGLLTGCSELRWHRPSWCPCLPCAPDAKEPSEKPLVMPRVARESPNYAPALYIPGSASAETTAAKTEAVPTLPITVPATTTSQTILPPLTPSESAAVDNPLQALHKKAASKWLSLESYTCRMRRREVVGSQPKPEEVLEVRFRREPFSVYFKWIGAEGKGREAVYVQGQHGSLIHTLTAAGDVFLVPGGTRFKVAPDSLLVKNKSRYPITEAGIGPLIERFGKLVAALDRSDPRAGSAKYLGQFKRKEFEQKVEVVLQTLAPGWEPQLPQGGQRLWCFDPEHGLPVLIVTHDEANREVEYYCHERFEFPGRLSDDDFHPDKLWQKSGQRAAAE